MYYQENKTEVRFGKQPERPRPCKCMNTLLTDKQITEVQDILIEELGIKREQLTADAKFIEDLGADSLAIVEITIRLEDEFGIVIPDQEMEGVSSVGDLLETLGAKVSRPA